MHLASSLLIATPRTARRQQGRNRSRRSPACDGPCETVRHATNTNLS
jgi:hypothetical protein